MTRERPALNSRLAEFGTTIFAEMSLLAAKTGAVNLGQGFPDTDGPTAVADAAIRAIRDGHNQYPPGPGIPSLRHAISRHQKRFWNLDFDPDTEVLVTAGATEALAAAMLGMCEPGDEVVTFEPYYDSYAASIAMAGAERKVVSLRAPDYGFDRDEFAAAMSPKTRLVLLNTPHNPTGKVFTDSEMTFIAAQCVKHDVIAITDEVYEHLVFDGHRHRSLASYPAMADRTVTISSGGKTFSFTGWKIGWACGNAELIGAMRSAKQFLTFVNGGPFQYGIAAGLDLDDNYYSDFTATLQAKRDLLSDGLEAAGLDVHRPQGTYFVTTDIRSIGHEDGLAFCLSLPERCGVVAVPTVVFYDNDALGQSLVRWAFCKRDEVLHQAIDRLQTLRENAE